MHDFLLPIRRPDLPKVSLPIARQALLHCQQLDIEDQGVFGGITPPAPL
jgi:hypothetical protein